MATMRMPTQALTASLAKGKAAEAARTTTLRDSSVTFDMALPVCSL